MHSAAFLATFCGMSATVPSNDPQPSPPSGAPVELLPEEVRVALLEARTVLDDGIRSYRSDAERRLARALLALHHTRTRDAFVAGMRSLFHGDGPAALASEPPSRVARRAKADELSRRLWEIHDGKATYSPDLFASLACLLHEMADVEAMHVAEIVGWQRRWASKCGEPQAGQDPAAPSSRYPDPYAEAKEIAGDPSRGPTLQRMAQAVLDTRQVLREEVGNNLKHMAELGGLLMVPAFASRRRPDEEPADTVRRLADDLDVAQRDLAIARGQVAELTEQVGQHVWNLAGCTTLAESRSMAHAGFDESQAGPALRAVRDLLRDFLDLQASAKKVVEDTESVRRERNALQAEVKELRRTLLADNQRICGLRQAIGMLATLKPTMEMRVDDPVGMAREVVEHIRSIDVGARRLGGMVPVADNLRSQLAHAEGLLADVARELTAAGVPENPDVGSRVRYLAQMSVNAKGLHPKPGAPDALHLFAAMIPGSWSSQADEWFTYRRIGTTPWVDVSWRHGPGVANSRAEAGPTCSAPTCAAPLEAGPSFGGTAPRAPYDRNTVADRIESIARGLTYNDGADEDYAKNRLLELAGRVRRGQTKDPAVSMEVVRGIATTSSWDLMRDHVQIKDVADILRALGLGDHARSASCHEIVQREILPAINRMASHVDRAKRVYLGLDASTPLESVVVRLAACAVQAFEAEKMWAGHCDDFQRLAAKHPCRIFAGESAVTALARLLDSPAEKELDKIRRAIDKRWFPPVGSSANLADEVASLADLAGKKANEAHRGDAAEKDLAEIRATVRGYDPTLGHSLRTVDAVKVLLERGGQRMKELAEIHDLLDRGGWPNMQGNPGCRLRLIARVADVASRARKYAEAEQMATERAQRAEAQLREVARRVAGWMPASEGVVGRETCSARPA